MDIIEYISNTKIQHGKHNDRIYVMQISKQDINSITDKLDKLCVQNNYSKIFAKVPKWAYEIFKQSGYEQEALIPKMKCGSIDVFFMSKFLNKNRKKINHTQLEEILNTALQKKEKVKSINKLPPDYTFRQLNKDDAIAMAKVYKIVFITYPFPIHDPNYLKTTMDENFIYFGIHYNNELVAIASCEIDITGENVEMTDFATLPNHRSKGLAAYLLNEMEKIMITHNIKTAFTIARALSYGMNITFSKLNYTYGGTLKNNTNISGKFETMNVWYKTLID